MRPRAARRKPLEPGGRLGRVHAPATSSSRRAARPVVGQHARHAACATARRTSRSGSGAGTSPIRPVVFTDPGLARRARRAPPPRAPVRAAPARTLPRAGLRAPRPRARLHRRDRRSRSRASSCSAASRSTATAPRAARRDPRRGGALDRTPTCARKPLEAVRGRDARARRSSCSTGRLSADAPQGAVRGRCEQRLARGAARDLDELQSAPRSAGRRAADARDRRAATRAASRKPPTCARSSRRSGRASADRRRAARRSCSQLVCSTRTSCKQLEADKRYWRRRLDELERELDSEPARIRAELRSEGHALRARRARVSLAGDRLMATRPARARRRIDEWLGQIQPGRPGRVAARPRQARRRHRPSDEPSRSRRRSRSCRATTSTRASPIRSRSSARSSVARRTPGGRAGRTAAPGCARRRAARARGSRSGPTYAVPRSERAGEWLLLVQSRRSGTDFDKARRRTRTERLARQPARAARAAAARDRRADRPAVQRHVAPARLRAAGRVVRPPDVSVRAICSRRTAGRWRARCTRCSAVERVTDLLAASRSGLPALLEESRKYQNEVSTELAEQVLEAL